MKQLNAQSKSCDSWLRKICLLPSLSSWMLASRNLTLIWTLRKNFQNDGKHIQINSKYFQFSILNLKSSTKNSKNCYSIIDQPSGKCLKRSCDEFRNMASNFTKNFEIKLNIADHSSMLKDIRCSAKPLEKIAGIKVSQPNYGMNSNVFNINPE